MSNERTTNIGIVVGGGTLILVGMVGIKVQANAQEDEPEFCASRVGKWSTSPYE